MRLHHKLLATVRAAVGTTHLARSRDVFAIAGEARRDAAYSALRTVAASYPAVDLSRYEARVFSQNGEDGVLAEIFGRIGVAGGGFFVEFGVETGVECNAAFLAHVCGWSGVFIEPDPNGYAKLQALWRNSDRVTTIQSMVTPANVNDVLAPIAPDDFDLLSIDIDGQDYFVWEAFTVRRPRVVVIEYNSAWDARRLLVQPEHVTSWDRTDLMGASIGAMADLGRRKGYTLVHADITGVNAFFVRDDLAGPFNGISVPMRAPNYFLRGTGHPPHLGGTQPVELPATAW